MDSDIEPGTWDHWGIILPEMKLSCLMLHVTIIFVIGGFAKRAHPARARYLNVNLARRNRDLQPRSQYTMEMYGDKLEFLIKALWIAHFR